MKCISYINDLQIKVDVLKNLKLTNDNADIDKEIESKELLIQKCKNDLSKLSSNNIEYRIYLKILNGTGITRAVEEVAEENYLKNIKPSSVSGVWNYYKKMKKSINL